MKKPQSTPIFDDSDFPISIVRKSIFQGTGVDLDEGRAKPIIGIANSLTEINPGHMHLGPIAQRVKEGVHAAGGLPFEFNVPAPCDGMTEGHPGMPFVPAQRDLIADINDFNRIIPTLCGISPNGPHGIIDLFVAGGIPAVMKMLADDLHPGPMTVSGLTVRGSWSRPWSRTRPSSRTRPMPFSPGRPRHARNLGRDHGPRPGGLYPRGPHYGWTFLRGHGRTVHRPRLAGGGPIAVIRDGDMITIDIPARALTVNLSDDEIKRRLAAWKPVLRKIPPGYMRRYIKMVGSAARGAVLE